MEPTPAPAVVFDPTALFTGTGDTLLSYITSAAPIGIPVMIGLIGLGLVIKLVRRTTKG